MTKNQSLPSPVHPAIKFFCVLYAVFAILYGILWAESLFGLIFDVLAGAVLLGALLLVAIHDRHSDE